MHYTINALSAEHLKKLDINGFPGSSICDVVGYGMTSKIDLKVRETPADLKNVENLWYQVLEAKEQALKRLEQGTGKNKKRKKEKATCREMGGKRTKGED